MTITPSELVEELQTLADELERTPLPEDIDAEGKFTSEDYYDEFDSWYGAASAAGLDRPIWPSIPEKELLGELHRLNRLLEKVPAEEDMAERGGYGVSTYWSRFGSWNAAIKAAGYQPNPDRSRRSDDALQKELHRLQDELGRVPSTTDMNDHGSFSSGVYHNRWGSWNEALEAAGLTPRTQGTQQSRAELIAELQRLAEDLGRPPKTTDMDDAGTYSHGVYYNEFESWEAALEAAGFD